eukprot:scaffold1638_cov120-Cylindrotheca_fusiformis.AAC.1
MVAIFSFLIVSVLAASIVEAKSKSVIVEDSSINISPNSDIGRHLMSKARRVEEEYNANNYYADMDLSFLADYSLKFQGCHHVQQWNANADEDYDAVRIMTKRLVRFRLCPGNSCNSEQSSGCSTNYGDYVIDMDTFLQAYVAAAQNNGYYGRHLRKMEEQGFDLQQFTECAAYQDNFYVGPYCASQGGEIRMGVFTDDTCSTFTSSDYYYYSSGTALPYSDESIVSNSCMSCNVNSDAYQYANYANGGDDVAQANDLCSNLYYTSGKCETKMDIAYANEGACSYIEGVKIIREDG